jgi:hypothetical protein
MKLQKHTVQLGHATVPYWAEAQLHGPSWWPLAAHANQSTPRACLERAQRAGSAHRCVVTAARAVDMAQCSMVRQSVNDEKVFGTSIPVTPATCHYTHISTMMTGEGSSSRRRAAQWWRSASTWTNGSKVVESLWA